MLIAGDFNIDLLKIHDKIVFGRFFDTITSLSFFPQITLPTRLSQRRGTIIDNFLLKLFDTNIALSNSGIITSQISDHFPYFICLDILKPKLDNVTKYVQFRDRHPDSITHLKKKYRTLSYMIILIQMFILILMNLILSYTQLFLLL